MREEFLDPGIEDVSSDPAEIGLRPQTLNEFIDQSELKEHLQIVLEAAKKRGQALDHLLFAGPPGLGKTTLAGIIATERGVDLPVTSGPALERAGDLAAILTKLGEGDVLFIDEIHRLSRAVEEILYPAMEDFKLDIVVGKGPAASSIRLTMPPFTLVGANKCPSVSSSCTFCACPSSRSKGAPICTMSPSLTHRSATWPPVGCWTAWL